MSEPELCIFQQSYCNECSPMWDSVAGKCKLYVAVNALYWSKPEAPPQAQGESIVLNRPLADSMKTLEPFPRFVPDTYTKSVTGQLVDYLIKEVETGSGPKDIAEVQLTDGSVTIKVTLWEDLAKAIEPYTNGDVVTITNLKVRSPYKGVESLNSTQNTEVST